MTTLRKDPSPADSDFVSSPVKIGTDEYNNIIDRVGGETALTAGKIVATDVNGNIEVTTVEKFQLENLVGDTADTVLIWNQTEGNPEYALVADANIDTNAGIEASKLEAGTKGDVLVSNGTNFVKLGVGANDQVIQADSSQANGVKWAAVSVGSAAVAGNYGELLTKDGSTAQSSIGTGYTKITGFATEGISNNTTLSAANDTITIDESGKYRVTFNISFSGTINTDFIMALFIDGIEQNYACERAIGASGDIGNASFMAIVDLTATEVLDIRVKADGTSKSITPTQMSLAVSSVGGGAQHTLLDSSVITDANNDTIARGDIVIANSTPKWSGLTIGAAGTMLKSDGTDPSWVAQEAQLPFVIDGGGDAITTGEKGNIIVPFNCTITEVTMLADQSGSIVVDIWKDTYANYPPTNADSITASAVPTISTAVKSQDQTLTGWTTSLSKGDILRYNVDSVTTITRVGVYLQVTRT